MNKLLKISAKYSFQTLRKYSPYNCNILETDISINREYWNHLVFQKHRDPKDFQERLLTVALISEILKTGNLSESRKNYYRIEKIIDEVSFAIIIKKQNKKYILLSSFVVYENYQQQKK